MSISLDNIKSGAGKAFAPIKSLSDIFIDNAEKMVALQLDSRKVYSDIAFNQLKKMSTISSMSDAGDFIWGQFEPIGAVNKQILADWKSFMSLNSNFTNDVKATFNSPEETPKKKAEPKKKAASAKTASKPVTSIIAAEPKPATKASKPKTTAAKKKTTSE